MKLLCGCVHQFPAIGSPRIASMRRGTGPFAAASTMPCARTNARAASGESRAVTRRGGRGRGQAQSRSAARATQHGARRSPGRRDLEPIVGHASAVPGQILEGFEPVEMVDRYVGDGFGLRETQIDRDAPAALLVRLPRTPERDATATRAEME